MAFLQKAVDCICHVTHQNLSVKPSKIVSGHEPEKTNELLQVMALAISNKTDSSDAVKKVLSGVKPSRILVLLLKIYCIGANVDIVRIAKKGKEVQQKNGNQENIPSHTENEERSRKERHTPKEEKKAEKEDNSKQRVPHDEEVKGNDPAPVEQDSRGKQNDVPPEADQRPSSPKGSRATREKLDDETNDKALRKPRSANKDTTDGPIRSAKSDRQRLNGAMNENDETPVPRVYSGHVERPSSARPAPPRPRKPGSGDDRTSRNSGSAKAVANVIVDNGNEQESEDETFVVEETQPTIIKDEQVVDNIEIENEEHGGLVKKILETKKELEKKGPKGPDTSKSIIPDATRKKERELVEKEIEKLRVTIQNLCRSANPLGKIMDYVQEDIDSMQKELETWRSENTDHEMALKRERNASETAIEPLKSQLKEIELGIADKIELISTVKANILRNEEKMQKMINGIFSSRS
ncbi:expressed hypothetical protein [Trichoplax adhaerens]|uniref:TRAF3-interacting protein 1 C-terminal domain-containing protein n=1 Tax=Trichoplax adhaerens TaxID=10228 RepID=B3RMC2_TRIAD|nr:expressed hypothetical protein [Trichoplax adhaerens]EDV27824.1 expressed hypothetical protein [Trichoplax adhaerens]|eukprot:XP_002109658.1 expressed hypothetical protein [Trichoplax adhaerens]